jgi:Immunoglobulin domain
VSEHLGLNSPAVFVPSKNETKFALLSSQQERISSKLGARVMSFYLLLQNPRRTNGGFSRRSGYLCMLALPSYVVYGCASGGSSGPKPIVEPPSITTQPASATVVMGQTATFTAAARGTPPLNYQWSKNGTQISGATATSYTTPPAVQGDDGATFTVTVTNAINSATSMPATLKVLPAPPPQAGGFALPAGGRAFHN